MPGYALRVAPGPTDAEPLLDALAAADAPATVAELHAATRARPHTVYLRLRRWLREGKVAALPPEPVRWALAVDPGQAPTGRLAQLIVGALTTGPKGRDELAALVPCAPPTLDKRLRALRRSGVVRRLAPAPTRYEMTSPALPNRTQRDRLWSAARVLRRFDAPQLEIAAEASPKAAREFIAVLVQAGYVRTIRPGSPRGIARYEFHGWTGPKAPVFGPALVDGRRVQRLRDRNTGAVVILSRPSRQAPGPTPLSRARSS